MWTDINLTYASHHPQNAWAHLVSTAAWHQIQPLAADGVTNVHLLLTAARASGKPAFVVLSGNYITEAYL